MKLLQVCNVGRVVGGTAACAWSILHAFPDIEHHVAFLSPVDDETRAAFGSATLHRCERVTEALVQALGVDAVLLHNTSPARTERIAAAWTLQYVHSRGMRAAADRTVHCSWWLARSCLGPTAGPDDVLHQCVPRPPGSTELRSDERPIVGRICTPTATKWPADLVGFYSALSQQHPRVQWEFIGCPPGLQAGLHRACRERAVFHPAGWSARSHLNRWHALLYHHPTLPESFGRTVAEAMRAGCVPIVDGRGGFTEQVPAGAGWLCGTAGDFSAAIGALMDPAWRQGASIAAMTHAEAQFSMAAFRRRLLAVWESAGVC